MSSAKRLVGQFSLHTLLLKMQPMAKETYSQYTGPVGSIIYADLYGSIKIKFTVLIRNMQI